MARIQGISKNLTAFLDMLAVSELGAALLAESDDGYNVAVGSTPGHVVTFNGYADHPQLHVWIENIKQFSSAAGRYQILSRYFTVYKVQLKLPDFGPVSQDMIAIQMIREVGAYALIEAGSLTRAIAKCASRWVSLPESTYKQPQQKLATLQAAYAAAGGVCA